MRKMVSQRRRTSTAATSLSWLCGALLVIPLVSCGSDSSVTTAPTQVKCRVTLTTDASSIGADGGSASLTVTTTPECPWDVTTATAWVSNLAPTTGQGNGTVAFRVASNPLPTARDADIVVNDAHLRVAQQAASCRYAMTPSALAIDASGGAATVAVSAMGGCGWTVTTSAPWIAIAPPGAGSGDGTVQLVVAANDDAASRSANLDLGGVQVAVTQGGGGAGPAPCAFALTPSGESFPAVGGSTTFAVATSGGCAWSATSTVPWAVVSAGAGGNGPGRVAVVVSANTGPARTGTLAVGGQTFVLVQAAASPATCTYRVTSTTTAFPDTGGSGAIAIATTAACGWTAVSDVSWITVTSGATGAADGSVAFVVAANTGAARTGTITAGGQRITVTQAAAPAPPPCTFVLTPPTVSLSDSGGAGMVAVAASAPSCGWAAVADVPWISLTAGASGVGDGSVAYTVGANTGAARSGTVTIGGQTVAMTQAAAPPPACAYGLAPSSASVSFLGGAGSVTVTTTAACAWTATSGAPWIGIAAGGSGAGPGAVDYIVAPNIGGARTGTVAIAGQTFTVTQAAVLPTCTYGIAPSNVTLSGSTTTTNVAVTAASGCAWTAVANDSWITVTSGASGNGNGTVRIAVAGKPGKNTRTGTATIAGKTFTVTQKD